MPLMCTTLVRHLKLVSQHLQLVRQFGLRFGEEIIGRIIQSNDDLPYGRRKFGCAFRCSAAHSKWCLQMSVLHMQTFIRFVQDNCFQATDPLSQKFI
jgi:hypothetical protein